MRFFKFFVEKRERESDKVSFILFGINCLGTTTQEFRLSFINRKFERVHLLVESFILFCFCIRISVLFFRWFGVVSCAIVHKLQIVPDSSDPIMVTQNGSKYCNAMLLSKALSLLYLFCAQLYLQQAIMQTQHIIDFCCIQYTLCNKVHTSTKSTNKLRIKNMLLLCMRRVAAKI